MIVIAFIILFYLVLLSVALCLIVAHIAIAITVYKNAKELSSPAMGLPPWVWALLSFSVPAVGMLCYWLMNHSILSKE